MWTITFPTGHITCCDPLVTLPNKPDTYLERRTQVRICWKLKELEMEPNEYRYVLKPSCF